MTRALIVVDTQVDFCEGGNLAVPGGLLVAIRIANALPYLKNSSFYDYVVATKDYHHPDGDNGGHFGDPPDFKDTWPAHCVQGTAGTEFAGGLTHEMFDEIFFKGEGAPAYSGFQGWSAWRNGIQQGLNSWLSSRKVDTVDVCGIAADYCVDATAEDGLNLGYKVRIIPNWTVAVGGPEAAKDVIAKYN